MTSTRLGWQSKIVLLLVLPYVAADVVLQVHWWAINSRPLAIWTIGLSLLLGVIALKLRSATPGAAAAGALITACLMFSTAVVPYQPWNTALVPVLALFVLTSLCTRLGQAKKERLGLAEHRAGRAASQVAANLGFAAIISSEAAQLWLTSSGRFAPHAILPVPILTPMLAALCESAADTVSSEIGQVFGGRPWMITTLKRVEPGTNGAISMAGTLAGAAAAAIVAVVGALSLFAGNVETALVAFAGGLFGLFFDSMLGATLERKRWLGNDLVNFLSTASASAFVLLLMALIPHHGVG